ncbi:MAG: hypothetical protein K9L21_05510 [Spirochaetia bacterium]|nr:hypothetical protein [Spirochaetia bacterium]
MRLLKILAGLCVVVVILAAALQITVKRVASGKIEDTIRTQIGQIGLKDLTFGSITIDLLDSSAEITDVYSPIYLSGETVPFGSFSARLAELKFSLLDAATFITGANTITEGSISFTKPVFSLQGNIPLQTSAETISLEFQGRITASNISQIKSGGIDELLKDEQTFIVRLGEFSLTSAGNTLLPTFLEGLNTRTMPVSGFEIAFLSSALLPDLPITRTFIKKVSNSSVMIDPKQFSRVAALTLQMLGIETETHKGIKSDGVVRATAKGSELVLAGLLENDLGDIDVYGLGKLDSKEASSSIINELSLEITNLDEDLSQMIGKNFIKITLDAPIELKKLIHGVYSF